MGERKGDSKWYDITAKLEEIMKREKGLLPNVDAYSASTYYMMGIPLDLYTPTSLSAASVAGRLTFWSSTPTTNSFGRARNTSVHATWRTSPLMSGKS